MYVQEICIEGFKSYAQRTVVPNFDQCFNAITGLNGSGKSNILDSICFVLGITNLSQVRAQNLQELVYKQGQAGVTKATVSIVFNNSDPEKSPAGYESCEQITVTRQIVIGGRNKYLINGHVAQPSRVQDLFHSVQLNVNNPHFLIMQGRITKVLNMKPQEILSMLEEASGTRMYETKKANALRTLEKKQTKVDEINKVLEEDILPALEKLRKERGQYMQWVSSSDQLDRLRRFCIAYEFARAQEYQTSSAGNTTAIQEAIEELTSKAKSIEEEVQAAEDQITALEKEKEEHMGAEVKQLRENVDEQSKLLVKETSLWNNKLDNIKAEKASIKKLDKTLAELAKSAEEKERQLAGVDDACKQFRDEMEAATGDLASAEQELSDVQTGKGLRSEGAEGDNKTMAEQLQDAKEVATRTETEAKQADLKVKHLDKEVKAKRKELGAKEKESGRVVAEVAAQREAVAAVQAALAACPYDEPRAQALTQQRADLKQSVRGAQQHLDTLSSQLRRTEFQYQDPERGFDRAKVKGVMARLIRVKEPSSSTALEVLAGNKLYQVVVDSDQTSRDLLNKGKLRQRVTIIPLNKIRPHVASSAQQAAAKKVAGNNAHLALSLVGYERELQAAVEYVFGSGFVCKDAEAAKKVAFCKDVHMRCATLEGDLFNPEGTLTGGSRGNNTSSVLARLQELLEVEAQVMEFRQQLAAVEAELAAMEASGKEHGRLNHELQLKQHSLGLLEERLAQSEGAQLAALVQQLEADLEAAQAAGSSARERGAAAKETAKVMEKELAEFSKQRDSLLKQAEGKVSKAKKAVEGARAALEEREGSVLTLAADRDALLEEQAAVREQAAALQAGADALQQEAADLETKVADRKAAYDELAAQLEERRARANECDTEIAKLSKEKSKKGKRIADVNVDLRKAEHKLARVEKEARDATDRMESLVEEYPWIAQEQQLFGQAGTDYDFDAQSPAEAQAELKQLSEVHEKMSKKVNKKVLSMFDKAEQEYKELTQKREIVQGDKLKIEEVISELDEKKKEALRATWEKVNKDFGSIFSTLLPGTMAKLQPPEGGDVLDGLEVRVAFGSVWKQSLTELSGGQRSLLALSLILALLLFKPAPIYILDEVDAALDLSHTQNIGRMIKTHFPQSQFIVVSLKEGMFNNADVIFRTKFVDGVSTVTRTVPALKDRPGAADPASRAKTGAAASKRQRTQQADQENVTAN